MAISRGMAQFAARFLVLSKIVFGGTTKRVRRAALAADQAAVLATPVDTGRLRANWVVSLGSPSKSQGLRAPGSNPGNVALTQGAQTIAQWAPDKGSIFISNGVPYAILVDQGGPKNAPHGMTDAAISAARAELRKGSLFRR